MSAFGYEMDRGETSASPAGLLDLADAVFSRRWRVVHGNKWVSTEPPGLRLHANNHGMPPTTLRLEGCLQPGRYRFDAEVLVFDARCPQQRITVSICSRTPGPSFSFDLEGGRPGPIIWSVPMVEVAETADVEIVVTLDAAAPNASYSAIQIVSAAFTPHT